uniref:Golgi transport 1Bb n=1 Tax=Cyprinus carpio carpio TaxID=630221 RepID=A0A9J7X0L6_CYPCA
MISLTDSQKIGMGLTGFGVFFLFFGMVLFFDKALLAIGNILFVAGLSFVIGLERTFRFFFQRHKMKATGFFLGGVVVVLIGWPIVGVVLEVYGFFLLFRGFFPVAVGFIRRVPILGSLLNLPGISGFSLSVSVPISGLSFCRLTPATFAPLQTGTAIVAVFSQNPSVEAAGMDAHPLSHQVPKASRVQVGPAADDAVFGQAAQLPGHIGQNVHYVGR